MSEISLVKVTRKGQMTIPQELRKRLQIEPGDYVALRPLLGGILLSKATVTAQVGADEVLRHLVVRLGQAAEQQEIQEEKDLDVIIDEIQRRIHHERYGP